MFLQLRYRRKQRRILNSQTSKMEYFAKIVNCHKPLTIFTKCSILDVWQGPEYVCESCSLSEGLKTGKYQLKKPSLPLSLSKKGSTAVALSGLLVLLKQLTCRILLIGIQVWESNSDSQSNKNLYIHTVNNIFLGL